MVWKRYSSRNTTIVVVLNVHREKRTLDERHGYRKTDKNLKIKLHEARPGEGRGVYPFIIIFPMVCKRDLVTIRRSSLLSERHVADH